MSIQIRLVQPSDGPALSALLDQLGYPDSAGFIDSKVAQQIRDPDAMLLVAEEPEGIVGLISLHFIAQLALAGDFCRISYLCVDQHARSAGVGALLEQACTDEARRRGCDRIELHCHQRRGDAHRFYARQGYEESPKYLMKRLLLTQ